MVISAFASARRPMDFRCSFRRRSGKAMSGLGASKTTEKHQASVYHHVTGVSSRCPVLLIRPAWVFSRATASHSAPAISPVSHRRGAYDPELVSSADRAIAPRSNRHSGGAACLRRPDIIAKRIPCARRSRVILDDTLRNTLIPNGDDDWSRFGDLLYGAEILCFRSPRTWGSR